MAVAREMMFRPERSRRETFRTVDAEFRGRLRSYFRSKGLGSADAEDLTQEALIRLAEKPLGLLNNVDAFVFTIARNLVRDRSRRSHIRAAFHSVDVGDADLASHLPSPEQSLENNQTLDAVDHILTQLKPDTQQAFYWQRLDGMSYAQIASLLGVSVSMVEKHIMSAIAALRPVHAG